MARNSGGSSPGRQTLRVSGREQVHSKSAPGSSHLSPMEQSLRQKTELLELSREAIFVVDNTGKIVFWNRGAEQLYGWKQDEVLGNSPIELLHTELPRSLPQIENILRRESHWDCELRHTTRQGNVITVA